MPSSVHRALACFALLALAACSGGGGAGDASGGAPSFALELSTDLVTVTAGGSAGIELRVTTSGGFGDTVVLDASGLPAGVGLALPESSAADRRTLVATFTADAAAVAGDAVVTVRGTAGERTATATLTVRVVVADFDFTVSAGPRAAVVAIGGSAELGFDIGVTRGVPPAFELAVGTLPTGIDAAIAVAGPQDLAPRLLVDATPAAAPGTAELRVIVRAGAVVRELGFLVHVLPPPLADGLGLELPAVLQVRRGDTTATELTVTRSQGTVGDVAITLAGLPAGVVGVFDDVPVRGAVSELQITASSAAPLGEHLVTIDASRGTATARTHCLVSIVDAGAAVDFRVQRVELAQAFFAPDPVLVAGKAAELRVHVCADEAGHPAPRVEVAAVAAGVALGARQLTGPAFAPNRESPANLAESFRTTLPADWVRDGLELTIRVGASGTADREPRNDAVRHRPRIGAAIRLDLVVVPIRLAGRDATAGSYRDMLLAHWPLTDVTIRVRERYTATSVTDVAANGDGWSTLLAELRSLQFVEGGAGEFWYGVVPVTYSSGVAGIGYVGVGTSLGWQRTTGVMLHELGHNFGLRHAPCGGAGSPDGQFPFAGGIVGTRGYDVRNGRLVDPRATRDLMGYCAPEWVSGYNSELVRARLGGPAGLRVGDGGGAPIPMIGVQGRIDAGGAATIDRVIRASLPWAGAPGGDLELRLTFAGGRRASFAAASVEAGCGAPDGARWFFAAVPDPGELEAIEVVRGGAVIARRAASAAIAHATIAADPPVPVAAAESGRTLALTWDAARWSEVAVVHVGARRLALATALRGGRATLDLTAVPAGGGFEITWSDGLAGGLTFVARR